MITYLTITKLYSLLKIYMVSQNLKSILYQAFFRHFGKNSSQNSGIFQETKVPKNAKRYLNRKIGTVPRMYLGFGNFQKLGSIFVKLRSVFEKLGSEI